MAIKKISEFVSGAPTSEDKILFEQNEKGKSTTIGDAVNTCSLSYEEIIASTADLTGKVASASALKHLTPITINKNHWSYPETSFVEQTDCRITIPANSIYGVRVYRSYYNANPKSIVISSDPPTTEDSYHYPIAYGINDGSIYSVSTSATGFTGNSPLNLYVYAKDAAKTDVGKNLTNILAWYITF